MTNKEIIIGGCKLIVAGAVALATFEGLYGGCKSVEADIRVGKEFASPTPIRVKNGRFGKERLVTVNPVTGEMKDYTGNKPPVNDKPYRLKKGELV